MHLHKVWIDDENCRATFPCYNLHGKMIGFQQYFPEGSKSRDNDPRNGKYFTYFTAHSGVWGMESFHLSNTLFITEGVFDAARLTSQGVSAIATISNNPRHLQSWLWLTSVTRPVIAVCDQDTAGRLLAKYGTESYTVQSGKDLGECSDEELDFILNKFL